MIVLATDDGVWIDGTRALEGRAVALAAHRERILCGTARGLWHSDDGGRNWARWLEHTEVSAVAAQGDTLWVGADPTALFRSRDGGRSWKELSALKDLPSAPTWSFPPKPETSHVRWIAPDPNRSERLFVAIEAGALVSSEDGGDSWHDRIASSPLDTHTLALPPSQPGTLFSAAGDGFSAPGRGFQESRDGGQSWSHPDQGLSHHYGWSVASAPDGSLTLISVSDGPMQAHRPDAAESYVYRRINQGQWERVGDALPAGQGVLAPILHFAAGHFYCASNRGLYRSTDGLHWSCQDATAHSRPNALLVV